MAGDLARPRIPVDTHGVESLLLKGERAYIHGQIKRAHDYWRAAATLAPYDERVWRALYGVVQTDADRRVCLQNIIAINPLNADARRQLLAYEKDEKSIE